MHLTHNLANFPCLKFMYAVCNFLFLSMYQSLHSDIRLLKQTFLLGTPEHTKHCVISRLHGQAYWNLLPIYIYIYIYISFFIKTFIRLPGPRVPRLCCMSFERDWPHFLPLQLSCHYYNIKLCIHTSLMARSHSVAQKTGGSCRIFTHHSSKLLLCSLKWSQLKSSSSKH